MPRRMSRKAAVIFNVVFGTVFALAVILGIVVWLHSHSWPDVFIALIVFGGAGALLCSVLMIPAVRRDAR